MPQRRLQSMDKCTKAAILWFCFLAHTVEQLGNKLLLFCYHSFRIFIMQRRIFCCFAPLVAEFFSSEKYSATLLLCYSATPVAEFFSSEKYSAILLLHYPSGRIFLIWETFCYSAYSATPVAEVFSSEKLSAILLFCSHTAARFFHQSASAIVVKLRHQNYLFGWGGEGLN